MTAGVDFMLARMRPLPARLRIAHLAALLRWERALSCPSPAERAGRVAAAEQRSGGGAGVGENFQLLRLVTADPHPDARFARVDPPRKGEGSRG
jgi:hypothetical protein